MAKKKTTTRMGGGDIPQWFSRIPPIFPTENLENVGSTEHKNFYEVFSIWEWDLVFHTQNVKHGKVSNFSIFPMEKYEKIRWKKPTFNIFSFWVRKALSYKVFHSSLMYTIKNLRTFSIFSNGRIGNLWGVLKKNLYTIDTDIFKIYVFLFIILATICYNAFNDNTLLKYSVFSTL